MTSEKVKLFCILDGDSTAFKVTVALDDDVDDLKKAIYKEITTDPEVKAKDLTLWHVAVTSSPARTIRLNNLTSDDTKNMLPQKLDESDDLVSDKFEAIPPKKTIHIIVQLPAAAASATNAVTQSQQSFQLSPPVSRPGSPSQDLETTIRKITARFFANDSPAAIFLN
ncbi:hypothetical protein BGX21_006807, partial [Mortierella sp. AD011]